LGNDPLPRLGAEPVEEAVDPGVLDGPRQGMERVAGGADGEPDQLPVAEVADDGDHPLPPAADVVDDVEPLQADEAPEPIDQLRDHHHFHEGAADVPVDAVDELGDLVRRADAARALEVLHRDAAMGRIQQPEEPAEPPPSPERRGGGEHAGDHEDRAEEDVEEELDGDQPAQLEFAGPKDHRPIGAAARGISRITASSRSSRSSSLRAISISTRTAASGSSKPSAWTFVASFSVVTITSAMNSCASAFMRRRSWPV